MFEGAVYDTEISEAETATAVGAAIAAGGVDVDPIANTCTATENNRGAPLNDTSKLPLYTPRAVEPVSTMGREATPDASVIERGETLSEAGSPESCTTALCTGSPSAS